MGAESLGERGCYVEKQRPRALISRGRISKGVLPSTRRSSSSACAVKVGRPRLSKQEIFTRYSQNKNVSVICTHDDMLVEKSKNFDECGETM